MKKDNITRTTDQSNDIVAYIKSKGFPNISRFAQAVGMDRQNVWARIKGKTNPDIRMLLKWSAVLDSEIDELIALFYPDEWKEYKA